MSRIVLTDKGFPFIQEFKIRDEENFHTTEIQQPTIKPLFLKRKVNPSKMILLKDGHNKFYSYESAELKQMCQSRQSARKASLMSSPQKQSPQIQRAQSQIIPEQENFSFINPLALKQDEFILKDQKLEKLLKKSISGVLKLPNPQTKKWGSLSTLNQQFKRNNFRFHTIQEAHQQSEIKLQKHIQDQMEQKVLRLEQHHQEEKFMKTLKSEEQNLQNLLLLSERFEKRINSRIKTIHTQRYGKIWDQMVFPKEQEKLKSSRSFKISHKKSEQFIEKQSK